MKSPASRRRKIAVWSFGLLLAASLAAPFGGLLLPASATPAAQAQETAKTANPRSQYWRQARQGISGYSAVGGESGVLIQNGGQNWRQARNGIVAQIGPWLLLAAVVAIALFFALSGGRVKVVGDEAAKARKILRWQKRERIAHWAVAISFVVLAVTGLSLLFGRALLIPVIGKSAFAAYADWAKEIHNYIGPLFAIALAVLILQWMRDNIPTRRDWLWIKKWGGMFGGGHPDAGRMNGGEKIWFWIICTIGVAVAASGFALDFPNFGQTRAVMQISHLVHSGLSILWICVALGHIYLGTIGTEGTLEGMTTGYVSEAWAKQHHNVWAETQPVAQAPAATEAKTPPAPSEVRA